MIGNYLRVIQSPRYRSVWLGQLVSNLGDTVNYVALVIDVFKLSGSGLGLSTLVLFQTVPVILAGLIAGPIIDRFPRRQVLIAADLIRAALAAGLMVAAAVWQVYLLAFGIALASVFFNPALSASIPSLIEGDDLLAANSVAWSTTQLVQIAGSALSGGLIAFFGLRVAFAFNAASYIISALGIALVAFPVAATVSASSYPQSVREGITYAISDRFVSRMLAVQVLASLAVGGTSALLVVLAERRYHLPPAQFATFLLAIAIGALLGPLVIGSLTRQYRSPRLLFIPYVVRGVGDILLGLFTVPLIGQALLFVYGLNTSTGMVTYQSAMQSEVPEAMRGRVFTLMDIGWNAARVISVSLGGILADRFGVAVVYYIGGMLLLLAGAIGLGTVRLEPRAEGRIMEP